MRKNAVLPYALIAVVGIVLVIVISVAGNNQRETLEKEANGDNQTEEKSEGGETADPEDIFKQSCASCHANDLSGDFGPDLRKVGKDHSADDIKKRSEERRVGKEGRARRRREEKRKRKNV